VVVDHLDLSCRRGTVLGLLGPNGAGKTTTLRMLYGFVPPDEGSIIYEGKPFAENRAEVKRSIGVCTQDDSLDYDFTVAQNLFIRVKLVSICDSLTVVANISKPVFVPVKLVRVCDQRAYHSRYKTYTYLKQSKYFQILLIRQKCAYFH